MALFILKKNMVSFLDTWTQNGNKPNSINIRKQFWCATATAAKPNFSTIHAKRLPKFGRALRA